MGKGRVEAFSDGVIAIIITIMVLELRPPHEATLEALAPLAPVFLSYVLSFVYLGIYWNNHHHLLQTVRSVTGPVMWANLHLLFWLSVVPFATAWLGEEPRAAVPNAVYGGVLIMCAFAYAVLSLLLLRHEGPDSPLARATGSNRKVKISPVLYAAGIVAAFFEPVVSQLLYVCVAAMWLVPDRRIERVVEAEHL